MFPLSFLQLRDMQTQQEEQHRSQVQSQTKLINLYQTSAADSGAQVKELTSAVTELQKLMKDASQGRQYFGSSIPADTK